MIWLLLFVLLGCSGAVSASETALFALNRRTMRDMQRSPNALNRRVGLLMAHPRRVLMTVLITNTAVNVAIFAVSFVVLRQLSSTHPTLVAFGGLGSLLAVILFGEIVPKSMALRAAPHYAPFAGALIHVLMVVLAPLRGLLQVLLVDPIIKLLSPSTRSEEVTTDELRRLVEHSAADGAISPQENAMLQSAIALHDVRVMEIMTPRVDLSAVAITASRVAIVQKFRDTRRRMLPVYGDDLDDMRGMLYARDYLSRPRDGIESLIRPITFVPEQADLVQLIRLLQEKGARRAVVVDEYGGTAGLVAMSDVGARIVGGLPDPSAPLPAPVTEQIDSDSYRVSGDLSVRQWAGRFGVIEIDRRVNTVGGLMAAKLGRLPRVGDTVRIRNLVLKVERMDRHRIEHVLLRREEAEDGAQEGRR